MAICGLDCCRNCARLQECGGCEACKGYPFGGVCVAAETINFAGFDAYIELKHRLIKEINDLHIPDLVVEDLNLLNGFYVNYEYNLSNGSTLKFLNDHDVYLGNQIERAEKGTCYGVVANKQFMLVCEYGNQDSEPEIICYKKIL